MQHAFLRILTLLALSSKNVLARWLEAVSVKVDYNDFQQQARFLDPVIWFDRIDQEESQDPADRSLLTSRPGDIYDCSNNVVPPGALLNSVAYYRGNINPQLPNRLNRLEIHRISDCEDDDPLILPLEVEDGLSGGEVGPEGEGPPPGYDNPWLKYNNDIENTEHEPNIDHMEEEANYDPQRDAIEEELALAEDDELQWVTREEAGYKRLKKRGPQTPEPERLESSDSGEGPNASHPTTNQQRLQDPYHTPQRNTNQRGGMHNPHSISSTSSNPRGINFEDVFANRNREDTPFRRLNVEFEGSFGGQADWDPMASESEAIAISNHFTQGPRDLPQLQENEFPIRTQDLNILFDDPPLPVTQNLRIQDPLGLLTDRRAPTRDTNKWVGEGWGGPNRESPHQRVPSARDIGIYFVELWPEIQLGQETSFRFVFDPFVTHDTNAFNY